jgi:hypothetical protein
VKKMLITAICFGVMELILKNASLMALNVKERVAI